MGNTPIGSLLFFSSNIIYYKFLMSIFVSATNAIMTILKESLDLISILPKS